MLKGVIFDMDGLMIDTEKLLTRFWCEAANHYGYPMTKEHVLGIRSLAAKYAIPHLKGIFGEDFDYYKVRGKRIELMNEFIRQNGIEKKKGLDELLYAVKGMLDEINEPPIVFDSEFNPDEVMVSGNEPFQVFYDEDEDEYVVEGPRIEKMLGYTNLESEKGFAFFQRFMKENEILDKLEALGIKEGETVRMYGLKFDYYK